VSQTYTVEAIAPGPSNAVRAHGHPVLESGNPSFPQGRYRLELAPGDDRCSFRVVHDIAGAALITRLLAADAARCACIVSSPRSGYRRLHIGESTEQEVRWDIDDLGEAPLFTPVILCVKPGKLELDATRDEVHPVWDGQPITLRKGSRLALGNVVQLQSSLLHLLSLHPDDRMADGQFGVEVESEPFRFRANVSTRLYRHLRYSGEAARYNVMAHIVTACLARLQRDYSDDEDDDTGWQSHRSLQAFADFLETGGHPHWTDDAFRPEEVATAIYPLELPDEHEA